MWLVHGGGLLGGPRRWSWLAPPGVGGLHLLLKSDVCIWFEFVFLLERQSSVKGKKPIVTQQYVILCLLIQLAKNPGLCS